MNTKRRTTCRAHRPLSRVSAARAMRPTWRRTPSYSWRRSTLTGSCTAVDGVLRSGRSVYGTPPGSPHGLMMAAPQCQVRPGGCQCKSWPGTSTTGPCASATCTGLASSSSPGPINTCHGTSACALSWSTEWTSNTSCQVETYEQCFCVLLEGSGLCPACTGDRLQKRVCCVVQRASGSLYRPFAPAL